MPNESIHYKLASFSVLTQHLILAIVLLHHSIMTMSSDPLFYYHKENGESGLSMQDQRRLDAIEALLKIISKYFT